MTPQEIAAGVAADIRKHGHYQGSGRMWSPTTPQGKCCPVQCPTAEGTRFLDDFEAFADALLGTDLPGQCRRSFLPWNDNHSTEWVLARLDELAAS